MEPTRATHDSPPAAAVEAWREMLRAAGLLALSAMVLLPGLGSSGRLSYHEAFVAQGAREMLESGNWAYPTIGGRPWLEKPPLPWWLTAATGQLAGGVDEAVARLPSAVAAALLTLSVASIAARRYGAGIGWLAGAVQATTAWTVTRGRLAEADILLACIITWAIAAFDVMTAEEDPSAPGWRRARWAFFALLGCTSLVKGIGFGAALLGSVVIVATAWRRDRRAASRLVFPAGAAAVLALSVAWPLAMIARHGSGALALWTMHVSDRLAARPAAFAGEPWWEYGPGILIQALPWTPLAFVGAWHSLGRALAGARLPDHGLRPQAAGATSPTIVAGDRLLWAWAITPLALLSLASVKNAHYVIAAQVPWSIWAALGISRVAGRLARRRPGCQGLAAGARLRLTAIGGFTALGLAWGAGYCLLGPVLDRRGVEWAFYESAARQLPPEAPVVLLYDDWDRNPYETPFGAFPHDLAVRLFYLRRRARWTSVDKLDPPGPLAPLFLIGRDRDRPALERLGHVALLARGPAVRFDRTYVMYRIRASTPALAAPGSGPSRRL